jgi:hypothetical protein
MGERRNYTEDASARVASGYQTKCWRRSTILGKISLRGRGGVRGRSQVNKNNEAGESQPHCCKTRKDGPPEGNFGNRGVDTRVIRSRAAIWSIAGAERRAGRQICPA